MTNRSWYDQRRFFYILFALIFFIHAGLLIIKFSRDSKLASTKSTSAGSAAAPLDSKPMTVKITRKALEDWRKNKKQIVDSENGDNQKRPEKSVFLSDKNRTFDRQTRARNLNTFDRAGLGDSTVSRSGDSKTRAQKPEKGTKQMKDIKLSDLGTFPANHDPYRRAAREYAASQKGVRNGDPQSRGVSSTNDYLADVPLGDLTHLNTQEFKYYGFYHRIRQKLEQFWGRSLQAKAEQMMKGNRRMPSSEDVITSLQVTLDPQGEIVAIRISGPSGIKELDDAAVESFNEAGPFPNPPRDLIVDGKVVLEWGFVVRS
jgi:TonB family protein